LTNWNNFGKFKQQFIPNIVLNDIYSYSPKGATKIKQQTPES